MTLALETASASTIAARGGGRTRGACWVSHCGGGEAARQSTKVKRYRRRARNGTYAGHTRAAVGAWERGGGRNLGEGAGAHPLVAHATNEAVLTAFLARRKPLPLSGDASTRTFSRQRLALRHSGRRVTRGVV